MFSTVSEIKAANKQAGFHFFHPTVLQDQRSEILPGVMGGCFFVTAEMENGERRYTIREVMDDFSINNVGGYRAFATAKEARAMILGMLR